MTTTPTPIAKGDQVLTARGVERVAHVKHNQIGTGQYVVFCGGVTGCAPATLALPALAWSRDPHTAEFEGVTLHACKTRHGWEVVARVEGSPVLRASGKTLTAVKEAAPRVAAVAAWHAAGNSWDLPTPETDPEEIKNREIAARAQLLRAEEAALLAQRGDRPARQVPEHSADAVARAVRSALKARDLLGKDWNSHLPTVEHTRDGKFGPGRVKIDDARESFDTIADAVRAGVSAELLAARPVLVDVFNGDLMSDYYSTVGVRIWPEDPETLRAAVLSGELSPVFDDSDPRRDAWDTVTGSLPADWVALADALRKSGTDPLNRGAAFAALVAQLERTAAADRAALVPALVALAPDWAGRWSELLPAVREIVGTGEAPEADSARVEDVEADDSGHEAPPAARTEANSAPVEWPEPMREYLARLIHAPKREHAEAVGRALLTGDALPECSAAWADDVERKVRRHVRELVTA